MTPRERRDPTSSTRSRRRRIARGLRHQPAGGQPPGQAVRRDAEADEAAPGGGRRAPGLFGRAERADRAHERGPTGPTSRSTRTDGRPARRAPPRDAAPRRVRRRSTARPAGRAAATAARRAARPRALGRRARWSLAVLVGHRRRRRRAPGGRRRASTSSAMCPPARSPTCESGSTCPATSAQLAATFLANFPGFADQASLDTKIDEALDQLIVERPRRQATGGHQALARRRARVASARSPDVATLRRHDLGATAPHADGLLLVGVKDARRARRRWSRPASWRVRHATARRTPARRSRSSADAAARRHGVAVDNGLVVGHRRSGPSRPPSTPRRRPRFADAIFKAARRRRPTATISAFGYVDLRPFATRRSQRRRQPACRRVAWIGGARTRSRTWARRLGAAEDDALVVTATQPTPARPRRRRTPPARRRRTCPPPTVAALEVHDLGRTVAAHRRAQGDRLPATRRRRRRSTRSSRRWRRSAVPRRSSAGSTTRPSSSTGPTHGLGRPRGHGDRRGGGRRALTRSRASSRSAVRRRASRPRGGLRRHAIASSTSSRIPLPGAARTTCAGSARPDGDVSSPCSGRRPRRRRDRTTSSRPWLDTEPPDRSPGTSGYERALAGRGRRRAPADRPSSTSPAFESEPSAMLPADLSGRATSRDQALPRAVRGVRRVELGRGDPTARPRRRHRQSASSGLQLRRNRSTHGSSHPPDPRRRDEAADLPLRRGRQPQRPRRPRARHPRALQPAHGAGRDQGRRREGEGLARQGRPAVRHRRAAVPQGRHPAGRRSRRDRAWQPSRARRIRRQSLVDDPDAVEVKVVHEDGAAPVIELHVAEDDMGKVIGRNGSVAKALRTLLKVVAARDGEPIRWRSSERSPSRRIRERRLVVAPGPGRPRPARRGAGRDPDRPTRERFERGRASCIREGVDDAADDRRRRSRDGPGWLVRFREVADARQRPTRCATRTSRRGRAGRGAAARRSTTGTRSSASRSATSTGEELGHGRATSTGPAAAEVLVVAAGRAASSTCPRSGVRPDLRAAPGRDRRRRRGARPATPNRGHGTSTPHDRRRAVTADAGVATDVSPATERPRDRRRPAAGRTPRSTARPT